jgi:cytochrome c556
MIRALMLTGLVAAAAPGPAAAQAQPTARQLIDARVAGMHMAATLFYRGVKGALTGGADVRQIFHEPEGLALWANAIPGLFPAGSGGEGSRARLEIWTDRAGFERRAADLGAAANRLAERARAGDQAGFAAAADAVEAACTACHSAYRSE